MTFETTVRLHALERWLRDRLKDDADESMPPVANADFAAWLVARARQREARHAELLASDAKYRAAHDEAEAIRAERTRAERIGELRQRGIPEIHVEFIVDGEFDATDAMKACREFVAGDNRFLVLCGPKGVGKTFAAGWAVAEAGGRLIAASELARTKYYDDRAMSDLERGSGILALDDLTMEFADAKGMFHALLDSIITQRDAGNLRTIITANKPWKTLQARYGERIADRVRGCGRIFEFDGPSLRSRRQ